MNEHQKYNQNLFLKGTAKYGWNYANSCGYKCIECGSEVSPAVMKFFDYDFLRIKCYNCQTNI